MKPANASGGPPPLATAPVGKLIWKFAIPGIISQVVNAVYNVVDQLFIGQGVGALALAVPNVALPLSSIVTALAALVGMGGAACFNLAVGRREIPQAKETLGTALWMLAAAGLFIGALASVFLRPMLLLFGATETLMPYAVPYARIVSLGVPFGVFATGASYLIRADGAPNASMAILMSGAIFNLFADPLFLFAFRMGIAGIALATSLGYVLSAGLALAYLARRFHTVTLARSDLRFVPRAGGAICSAGSAVFLTHICAIAVQILQNNSFRHYGALSPYGSEIPLAAIGAVSKVNVLLMSTVIGISLGCQPIYGFNYGSRRYHRVKETYLLALRYATVVSVVSFLCLQLFPEQIVRLFGAGDALFFRFAARYVHIYLLLLFAGGLLPVSATFFSSIGKAGIGRRLTLIKQLALLIPLTLLLPLRWGLDGVLAAGPIADGVTLALVLYFARREVRELDRLQAEEGVSA